MRHQLAGYHGAMDSLRAYRGTSPTLGERVYVDPAASVIGDVTLDDDVSIWPGAVLRGDVQHIQVGARSNIQDGAVVHVTHDGPYTPGGSPCVLGIGVTIGHAAVVHACSIGDYCLVGMHATVLDGAVLEPYAMVGANSLVTAGTRVGPGELWLGSPARRVRALTPEQIEQLRYSADHYVLLKDEYLAAAPDPGQ
jgi:carbonic anhydrase/acetyltransferase-like protein (isoleucine patch superfamily)